MKPTPYRRKKDVSLLVPAVLIRRDKATKVTYIRFMVGSLSHELAFTDMLLEDMTPPWLNLGFDWEKLLKEMIYRPPIKKSRGKRAD